MYKVTFFPFLTKVSHLLCIVISSFYASFSSILVPYCLNSLQEKEEKTCENCLETIVETSPTTNSPFYIPRNIENDQVDANRVASLKSTLAIAWKTVSTKYLSSPNNSFRFIINTIPTLTLSTVLNPINAR
jgi:hypothetical protein